MPGERGLGIEVDEKILKSKIVDGMEPFDPAEPPWVFNNFFFQSGQDSSKLSCIAKFVLV